MRNPYLPNEPRHWRTHGVAAEDEFQRAISTGVIQSALAEGRTVSTASALTDPRFSERESVKKGAIEAVLCAPIGKAPPFGVVYLQGRREPGRFTDADMERAELCAKQIAPLADRLMLRRSDADPTSVWRDRLALDNVVGRSHALANTLEQIALCAPLDVSVLLTGPTGTGKSYLARAIHTNSKRAAGPFIELNCAAIPDTLLESELFGAQRGAHSTATKDVPGKVRAAEGGTLFLDEIGELSMPAQAKLLQLLQSKEYFPLGAAEMKKADVRVLAATNVDLQARIARKEFREDLYYRLQVLPIRVPSLAERRADVVPLARKCCADAAAKHGLPQLELSVGAMGALETAEWPGNVRQLFHCVEAGAIRATAAGMAQIGHKHLFPDRRDDDDDQDPVTLQEATRRFQRELVSKTLRDTGWNVTEAAKRLDVARSYLYKLIQTFGLKRDA